MLYIRFLNFQTPLQDIEKMYKDGDIKYGDIVCQQYNDKSSHLFMNGTWVKTLYNSKIKQNNESLKARIIYLLPFSLGCDIIIIVKEKKMFRKDFIYGF